MRRKTQLAEQRAASRAAKRCVLETFKVSPRLCQWIVFHAEEAMTRHFSRAVIDHLESRRLLSTVVLDSSFGVGGQSAVTYPAAAFAPQSVDARNGLTVVSGLVDPTTAG